MKSEISIDTLLGGNVYIAQPVDGYRVAIDPIFLAASVGAQGAVRVLDVGCGDGGATLCLAWRSTDCEVHGIDLREDAIERLGIGISKNHFEGRVTAERFEVVEDTPSCFRGAFDWVISNPPYLPAGRADRRGREQRSDVENIETVPLEAWLAFMLSCAKDGGHISVIHRADRIDEILAALQGGAGDIVVVPLWPRVGAAAKRVIVQARKGTRGPSKLHPGLVLHDTDGELTAAASAILNAGGRFDLS